MGGFPGRLWGMHFKTLESPQMHLPKPGKEGLVGIPPYGILESCGDHRKIREKRVSGIRLRAAVLR